MATARRPFKLKAPPPAAESLASPSGRSMGRTRISSGSEAADARVGAISLADLLLHARRKGREVRVAAECDIVHRTLALNNLFRLTLAV